MKQKHYHSKFLLHKCGGGVITNEASTTYTYQPDPNLPPVTTTEPTTPTTVAVNTATVNPTKSANQAFVDIGDIITYTISLQNNGTVPLLM